jgi:ribosomal protein S27AE
MTYPNPDCPACGGEGIDADPWGMFDGDHRKACPQCADFQKDNDDDDEGKS